MTPDGQNVRLTLKQGQGGHTVTIGPGKYWDFEPENMNLSLKVKPELNGMLGDQLSIAKPVKNGNWSIYIQEKPGHSAFALEFVQVW